MYPSFPKSVPFDPFGSISIFLIGRRYSHSQEIKSKRRALSSGVSFQTLIKSSFFVQYRYYRALENATQDKLYRACGEEVINACLEGYNGTILAYGQTGAGKTYSMFGPDGINLHDVDYHGVMPRAFQHVREIP